MMSDWQTTAARVLSAIAAFDAFPPPKDAMTLQLWAVQLQGAGYAESVLLEAVARVYRREEVPKNRLGAILAECKRMKLEWQNRQPRPELPAPERVYGNDVFEECYTGALTIRCPRCSAGQGAYCEDDGKTKRRPHLHRAVAAMRVVRQEI